MRISIALAFAASCLAGPLPAAAQEAGTIAEPEAGTVDQSEAATTAEASTDKTGVKTALASRPADPRLNFRNCDGYGAPSGSKDGIGQRPADVYWLAAGDRSGGAESERSLGGEGVKACTAALADPRLLPSYRVRKASLLRARAAIRRGGCRMSGDGHRSEIGTAGRPQEIGQAPRLGSRGYGVVASRS